ncbi:MAG: LysR family transcriptional regulator [Comamonas sp.]
MKLDNISVQLLIHIKEEGSIARAADKLNLAVASASKRLSDIETQLDLKIFKRLPHGVQLTEAGEHVMGYVQQIDQLLHRLESDALALHQGLEGRIVIGAPKSVVLQYLASDIAKIQNKYKKIRIEIIEENSKIVQNLLKEKIIDIGIYEKTSGFIDLLQHEYKKDEISAVFNPKFFHIDHECDIDFLHQHPIITLGKGSAIANAVQRAYRNSGKNINKRFVVSGFDSMTALIVQGLGIGLMPPSVLNLFNPSLGLKSHRIAGDWAQRRYVLSFLEGRAHTYTLRNVVAELLEN